MKTGRVAVRDFAVKVLLAMAAAVLMLIVMPRAVRAEGSPVELTQASIETYKKQDNLGITYELPVGEYELKEDITISNPIYVRENGVTLDLNSHTLTLGNGGAGIHVVSDGSLTLCDNSSGKSGTVIKAIDGVGDSVAIYADGDFTLLGGTVNSSGTNGVAIMVGQVGQDANVTLSGGKVAGSKYAVKTDYGSTVTINGAVETGSIYIERAVPDFSLKNAAVSITEAGNLTLQNGATVSNEGVLTNEGTIRGAGTITNDGTISGTGTFTNSGTLNGNGSITGGMFIQAPPADQIQGETPLATVTDGTTTIYAVGEAAIKAAASVPGNTVTVTQGSVDLSGTSATILLTQTSIENYKGTDNLGETCYKLPSGNYKLNGDIQLGNPIRIGSMDTPAIVSLDLNGHTLSSTAYAVIRFGNYKGQGSLTLDDSSGNGTGKVSGGDIGITVDGLNYSKNILIMNGGTVSGALYALDIPPSGSMNANGGTVEGAVRNVGTITSTASGGTVFKGEVENTGTIIGGIFEGKVQNTIRRNDRGDVSAVGKITGGTFKGEVENSGEISGGVFHGNVNNNTGGSISGGTFYGTFTDKGGTIADSACCTVTFDSDGGNSTTSQKILRGQKVSKPEDPAYNGYKFGGWYDGDTAYSFDSYVTSDLTLTARWEYTVKFDKNGADLGTEPSDIPAVEGEDITIPGAGDLRRSGYQFAGWNTQADGNGKGYTAGSLEKNFTPDADGTVTLYADWAQNVHAVSYSWSGDVPSGASLPGSGTAAVGETIEVSDAPSVDGYTFSGWSASGVTITNGEFTMPDHDVILTGTWTKNSSSVVVPDARPVTPTVRPHSPAERRSEPRTYDVTVSPAKHGSVSVSREFAAAGTTVTVTVSPDEGYTLETLTVTDRNGKELNLTDEGNDRYSFVMPAGNVTVKAAFVEDDSMLNSFVDVPSSAYYYDAVKWAAENGITSGTDAVHFSPNAPCTRAQMVTFLWRAAGSPDAGYDNPFDDVADNDYYAKAVTWAAKNGITSGTSANTFSPNEKCVREQFVTFLYRYAKYKGMDVSVGEDTNILSYGDADEISEYAIAPFQWACGSGLVDGYTDGNLGPKDECTRAQGITILYRMVTGK